MNETSATPQEDETKASSKTSWIKPELIQLMSQATEGKMFYATSEGDSYVAPS